MTNSPLHNRLGLSRGKPIDNDLPSSTRTALKYLFIALDKKNYLIGRADVLLELHRIGRVTKDDFEPNQSNDFINQLSGLLVKLNWIQIYSFCERVYAKLLQEYANDYEHTSLLEVRQFYSEEINNILDEDNIAYHFSDGLFYRRGRAQTQKVIYRVGMVLDNPQLVDVKKYYNKARYFFDLQPKMDSENCIKEALCALEACIEVLTKRPASKNFDAAIQQLEGNNSNQIPPPIGEAMKKLHSYRGSGQGVAHAAIQGNRVQSVDAELVLSLVASFITYLVDLYLPEEDIPF